MKKFITALLTMALLSAQAFQAFAADPKFEPTYSTENNFMYWVIDDDYTELVNGNAELDYIPDEIDGHKITKIGRFAYSNPNTGENYDLSDDPPSFDWIIPDGVTAIGEQAFDYSFVKSIEIPTSVVTIGEKAFRGVHLKEITVPGSVDVLPEEMLSETYYLKKAVLNEGVKQIGRYAFRKSSVEEVSIPSSVAKIGKGAFYDCKDLHILDLSSLSVYAKLEDYSVGYKSEKVKDDKFRVICNPMIYRNATFDGLREYVYKNDLNYGIRLNDTFTCEVHSGDSFTLVGKDYGKITVPDNKVITQNENGELTALKKGKTTVKIEDGSAEGVQAQIVVYDNPCLTINDKAVSSVKVRLGKAKTLKLQGKAKAINNKYTSTAKAKITSKKSASTIKIKGLKKGSSTVKIKVNGAYTIKLKVKVV